jgi:Zn-dependent peptidase ImmA (M78 family)
MTPQEGIIQARQEARNLHRRFGVESVHHVDVHAFAERLKVQIVEAPLQGAFAQLVVNRRRARILLSKRLEDPGVRRVAIAHELGHYVLGHPSPPLAELCMTRPQKACAEAGERDFENEAHGFALELLTPARAVDAFCRRRDPDLTLCAQLAISAWVPIEHAAIRITEASERICAAVLSTRKGIVWACPSRRFFAELGESLTLALHEGHPLDPRSLAWRILDRAAPHAPAQVPAEAWLGMPGLPLFEESAPIAHQGAVLTTLWAASLEATLAAPSSRSVH